MQGRYWLLAGRYRRTKTNLDRRLRFVRSSRLTLSINASREEESEKEDSVIYFELLVMESGRDVAGVMQLHYLSHSSISYKYVYNIIHQHE